MQIIKDFFQKHQDKIILTIGAILIAGCSFAAGKLTVPAQKPEDKPIEIKQEETTQKNTQEIPQKETKQPKKIKTDTKIETEYVGSVEGGTYFLANSKLGQAISENKKIWFETQEEAEEQGYNPSKDIKTTTKANSTTEPKTTAKDDEEKGITRKDPESSSEDCNFVASSRGKKYYKAGSSSAKSLSEQNIICFSSEQEAEDANYEPSASLK